MSNGQAERLVDTFKRALRKLNGEGTSNQNLLTFLQCYRSTPNRNTLNKKSPAEVILCRNIRTSLNLIKPQFTDSTKQKNMQHNEKIKLQFDQKHDSKQKSFSSQDMVNASIYTGNNSFSWKPGLKSPSTLAETFEIYDLSTTSSQNEESVQNTTVVLDELSSKTEATTTLPTFKRSLRSRRPVDRFVPR